MGDELTTHPRKKRQVQEPEAEPRIGLDTRRRTCKRITDYAIGSWNVRSLYKAGVVRALTEQVKKYKLDIIAIQETRWLGSEITDMRAHTILKNGKSTGNQEFGVAFMVDKALKPQILDFKPVNERLSAIRIKAKFSVHQRSCPD